MKTTAELRNCGVIAAPVSGGRNGNRDDDT